MYYPIAPRARNETLASGVGGPFPAALGRLAKSAELIVARHAGLAAAAGSLFHASGWPQESECSLFPLSTI